MKFENIHKIIIDKGLKVTPQRLVVLETVLEIKNHPTAEKVIDSIKKNHPNIAIGTIYKTLETFVKNGIIKKVKTEKDIMRYDVETKSHHHLYCDECEYIENYYDDELDKLLKKYFERKQIPEFSIKEINLQIVGSYNQHKQN